MGFESIDPGDLSGAADRRERRREERRRARESAETGATTLRRTHAGRVLLATVATLAFATALGLLLMWPPAAKHAGQSQAFGGHSIRATVTTSRTIECPGPAAQRCRQLVVDPGEGRDKGHPQTITLGPVGTAPKVDSGAHVRIVAAGQVPTGAERYSFADYDRRGSLLWLGLAFAALAIVLARWRGLLALAGLALSLVVVTKFVVPAILAGSAPLLVALVGSLAVMFVTLGLTYGLSIPSLAAAIGIAASLLLTAALGAIYVSTTHLNGYSSDLSTVLSQGGVNVSLEGIVLAGVVIGALGVLADTAVSQASAVMALRHANPAQSARELYRGAFSVGRDHLTATIHTLVLAYVGAALPLLLVLQHSGVTLSDAINTQDVAEPIVATLVGAIGLIAAVPLTTMLAAQLARHVPAAALEHSGGHAHAH
jgi:uncharacterized membrane protein